MMHDQMLGPVTSHIFVLLGVMS